MDENDILEDLQAYQEPLTEVIDALADEENMHRQLVKIANSQRPYRMPRGASKAEVKQAFNTAFELIGGVPRLAVWANDHPKEFYSIFAKLHTGADAHHSGKILVEHVLKRNKLDEVTIDEQGRVIEEPNE